MSDMLALRKVEGRHIAPATALRAIPEPSVVCGARTMGLSKVFRQMLAPQLLGRLAAHVIAKSPAQGKWQWRFWWDGETPIWA